MHALPLQQNERIQIIDSIRGIALLGILLMNIPYFGMSPVLDHNLSVRQEYSGANYYTWWIVGLFFEGTMRGLFSLLFGAGCVLLLERLERRPPENLTPADIYYRRLIWLMVFGFLDANVLLWTGDVLYVYAACGLLLYPFRHLNPRVLILVAVLSLVICTWKQTNQLYASKEKRTKGEHALQLEKQHIKLTKKQEDDKKAWQTYLEKNNRKAKLEEVREDNKTYRGSWLKILQNQYPFNRKFQSLSVYHQFFWDMMTCFFLGMAFYKLGILTGKRSKAFYWRMLVIGYTFGLSINYWQMQTILKIDFDSTLLADQVGISWYQIRRLLNMCGHLGLILLMYKYELIPRFLRALAAVGQMAFTNYLGQSIICGFIFNGYGLRWFGALERFELYYVVGMVWVFQIIFSSIWLRYYRFGPFEWAWRSLTYWKAQPFRRNNLRVADMA